MTSSSVELSTSLSKASFDGDLDSVTHLLESGVDYLESDDEGKTALHWAVAQRHPDVIHTLAYRELERLAARTRSVITPVELAAEVDDEAIFEVLLENLEPFSNTMVVFNRFWLPLFTSMTPISEDSDFKYPFNNDHLPPKQDQEDGLHYQRGLMNVVLQLAIKDNKLAVVDMLLHLGADANASYGEVVHAPLDVTASYRPNPAFIRLLLKYGANPNAQMSSPLSAAIHSLNERALIALLDGGASVNHPNGRGDSPLKTVCSLDDFDHDASFPPRAVRTLVNAGATVDVPTLHFLVRTEGGLAVLKESSERGVDITVDDNGQARCALSLLETCPDWVPPEEYQAALDIFATAYGTLPRLRNALLSENNKPVRYDLLLRYGPDADGPLDEDDLDEFEQRLDFGKPLPAYLETFMDSDYGFPFDRSQLIGWVNYSLDTPSCEQLDDDLVGVLRVLAHCGEMHPGIVMRHLFQLA
ncbi:hypothetical protein BKA70DRAFT_1428825 [Coprinopsis sp. MPI-PUGE-AT-0042]|nr:hypothetical protein BKA70DRAFT_1428825 [Coprinopsis sp. MPI-PUGE-AT-0042]